MKSLFVCILCTFLAIVSCGRITNDDYSVYSVIDDFGSFRIDIQPHRSGIIFIHYGSPYDFLLSYSFEPKIKIAKIDSIILEYINQPNSIEKFEDISLPLDPKPGDIYTYYRIKNAFSEYKEFKMTLKMELTEKSGKQKTYIYTKEFNKQPNSRWWFFLELV